MGRSSKKPPYIHPSLLKKVLKAQEDGDKKVIKTWSRASVIYPEFVGLTIGVYNGKDFIPVVCDEQKVGFRLGEFSPTRRFRSHSGKLAK